MFDALPPAAPSPPTIVVTGRALPEPEAERAYHVDMLDRAALADGPAQTLDQLLTRTPGLQLFRRSNADSAHPTSQGITLRALGGNASSRALLVLDGVPQADPFGGWVNWPAYDPSGLQQVRVVRGGGSVGHGAGSLAGTIEMRSLAETGVLGSIEGGSRESLNGRFYGGTEALGGRLTLNVQAARSDGFVPVTKATRGPVDRPAPYEEASIRPRWIAPIGSDTELQLGGLAFADERERGVPFTDNRTRGADGSVRLVGTGRWQWSALGYAQWREMRSSFASVAEDRASASRVSLQHVPSNGQGASVEVRPPVGQIELRAGADLRFTSGESRELFAYVSGEPTRRRVAGGKSRTEGLFAEASLEVGPVTMSGGARLDHWRIWSGELVERPIAGGPPTREDVYPARNGWRPTGRVGATMNIAEGASLRMAAYRGWRLPALNELFRAFRAGSDATAANALLDPETLAGAEIGIDYRMDAIDFSVTAFANRLSDAIANVTLGHGPGNFPGVGFVAGAFRQRQNLEAIKARGIEATLAFHRGRWSADLGASLTRARVVASGPAASLDGLRPAQAPAAAFGGSIGWEDRGRGARIFLHHTGPQFEDDLNLQRLKPATTVDAFLAWPLTDRFQLIARGVNLLDETVVAGVADDGAVERATPRTFWLGIRLRAD